MPTEKDLQGFLLREAKKVGILAYKVAAVGRRGFPDCILIAPDGEIALVEVKHPNGRGRLSIQQQKLVTELTRRGANIHVIDNKRAVARLLESYGGSD